MKLWYDIFVQQILEHDMIATDDVLEKDILIVGGNDMEHALGESAVPIELERKFRESGVASCDRVVLFQTYLESIYSIEDLEKCAAGKQYDLVIVLDGMEKAQSFSKAVSAVKSVCAEHGKIILLARTPNERGTQLRLYYYDDIWRYEWQDVVKLFPEFRMESGLVFNPAYFIAVKLERQVKEEKPISSRVEIFNCRAGKRITQVESQDRGYFSKYRELDTIGIMCYTDKCRYDHNYLDKYEFFLRNFKMDTFNLLELGVYKGASERMWKKYFLYAQIFGVDINEACKQYEEDRIKIIIADLSREDSLQRLKDIQPAIIVDDASHLWSHQIKALFVLFEALPSGGIYIMEDLETSVNVDIMPGFSDCDISAYEVCSQIAEVVASKRPCQLQHVFAEQITQVGMQTEMISLLKGSCIFIKR